MRWELSPSTVKAIARSFLEQEGLLLVTISNAGSVALASLLWFVIARLLSVSEYGSLNYLISIGGLAASLVLYRTSAAVLGLIDLRIRARA